MVPDPFVIDIGKALDKLPEDERSKFYEEVNKCIENTDWLRENRLNINNPNRDIVTKILYNQLY